MKKILFILLAFISLQGNSQTWVLIKKLDSGGAFKIGTISLDLDHHQTTVQVQSYDDYISILQGTNPITSTYIQLDGIFTNKHDILLNMLNLKQYSGAYLRILETLPFNTDTIMQAIPSLIIQMDSIHVDTIKRIGKVGANDYIDYSLYHKAVLTITKHCTRFEYPDSKVSFLIDNTDTIPGTNCATYDYIKGVQKYYGWKDSTVIKNFIPYIPKSSFDNR